LTELKRLQAIARAATDLENAARDAYKAAQNSRAEAFAEYNIEAAREAGIEIGKTVLEAARYSYSSYDLVGRLHLCVALKPSQNLLGQLVVRDVTKDGKPWKNRRPYTVLIDKVRVTDRTVPEV
jgi:hypothetical protein